MVLYTLRLGPGVILVAEALLVTTCHESCTRRATDGGRDISICKANAILCDGIDVWCRDILTPVAANVSISHVIGGDDDDVWFSLDGPSGKLAAGKCDRCYAHPCSFQKIASFHVFPLLFFSFFQGRKPNCKAKIFDFKHYYTPRKLFEPLV